MAMKKTASYQLGFRGPTPTQNMVHQVLVIRCHIFGLCLDLVRVSGGGHPVSELDDRFDQFRLEGTRRCREGALKHEECERQRDFNGGVEVLLRKKGVDVLHGRDEELGGVVWVHEHFVSHCGREEALDVAASTPTRARPLGPQRTTRGAVAAFRDACNCARFRQRQRRIPTIVFHGVGDVFVDAEAEELQGLGEVFNKMIGSREGEGNEPYIILSFCSLVHVGLVDEGFKHFKSMREVYGLVPPMEHFSCMVDFLGRASDVNKIKDFIKTMPVDPNALIWRTILGACCRANSQNSKLGRRAAQLLIELEPRNAVNYVLLSNMHAAGGNWEDVAEARWAMKNATMKKEAGCSWVNMKDGV
ncbi:hypothetical protein Fmac_008037 [Flemingia macrophylla]|uniref:Pentatricopeptide repeat-containing protein n=1 Tax=Flemingia macrophylla TaxID=520843 RepID=A0ABD1MX54_9FABA